MSIARDAGIISEAQQKEIDALFTGKDGKFDEEAFAEAFARELKRAFHETVQKRMEDVPATKAGRALRRVADFIATLAKSFAFWRQERGLDPVTGQPFQAGQVLDAFLKSARTSVDEATRLDNLARAARAASLRATAEARDNAPTQTVTDEDGTEVAYHERGNRVSAEEDAAYLDAVERGDTEAARRMVEERARKMGVENPIPEQTDAYKVRVSAPPKKTIKVYKVFTIDQAGRPTALFVSGMDALPMGVWLDAQDTWHFTAKNGKQYIPSTANPNGRGGKTGAAVEIPDEATRQELIKRGFLPQGSKAKTVVALAYRPGWHAGDMPFFPQGGVKRAGSNYGNVHHARQVVFECEMDADHDYTEEARNQPKARTKDGRVNEANADLQSMPDGGFYRYSTNPLTKGGKRGTWFISGSLKINRALTQEEADRILQENGFAPQEWEQGELDLAQLGYRGDESEAARKTLAPVTYDDNGNVIPLSRRFDAENVDIRWHISDSERNTWNEGVRDYLEHAAKMDGDMYWRLTPKQMFSEAPDVLKFLSRTGVLGRIFGDMFDESLPIKVDIGVMDKIHQGTDARRIGAAHTHDLTDDDLYRLIDAISDPLAIAVSNVHPENSIVFFTELLERKVAWNGEEYYNPVLIPLLLKTRGSRNDRYYEITSAYGISNPNTWRGIIEQLSKYPDELLYVNKGKLSRHESPRFSQKGQRTYVAPKERGLRRLADTLQNVMSHSRNRVPDEWGYKKIAPELHKPSSPSIIDQPASETQGENKSDPNEERRDHIKVWSGARQAYDRVDLRFIGSGTGGNNEGRGAYSSGVRGVAQDRYAMYKVAEWKEAKEIGFSPDNLPIVYDGKAMRLGVAVGRARSNVRVASEKGISPSIEDEAIIRIYSDAQTYLLDNGFLDYDEFRYYIFSVYVRLSPRLDGLLFTIRSLEKVLSSPREKRMMYKNNKGTAAKWSSTRTLVTESNGEMRDVYVVDDEYGGVNYIDVEYAQKLYEQSKRELEENKDAFKEEQENYEKVRALYDGILPEENPLASETELPLPAVMEQTWFTNREEGDVSHLLSWLDAVTPEQMGWIVEAAKKAGFSEEEIAFLQRERIDDDDVLIEDGNRMPSGSEMYMRLELIAMMRDNQFVTFDEVKKYDLWKAHREVMGEVGKFASEFLLTADIDGVMYPVNYRGGSRHGEEGWNYVAFSDEHLRVDHVYEYNPETDEFEKKWHEGGGSVPRFTETPLGQELVARAFDAIVGSRVDLLLRPSRYYGNPYETRERNPRNALVTEHLHRDVDVSEPKGFATEVSAEISRFGTREGDPTLREIRARCGSKARFYEVLGAVYETAEAVRSGLSEVVTGRERTMMSNAGLLAAEFIKHNATARATALGRKLYLMGREFAWKLYQEDIASARAEVERQRRGRGDCGMIGGKCEGKGPSRHGERRWPKARRMR